MLLGKTIVVTGIASGIGARIGELASALGAEVIGVDVKPPAAPLGAFVKADLSSPQAIAELAATRCPAASTPCAMSPAFPASRAPRRPWRSISMACAR